MSRIAAFFDVDETLISLKSMMSFLMYYSTHPQPGEPVICAESAIKKLMSEYEKGTSREELNQLYYALYAGCDWSLLLAMGEAWFDSLDKEKLFIHSTVSRLRQHQERAHCPILVSGSFLPCLAPVARKLNVDILLCTQMQVDEQNKLTGNIVATMIGEGKRNAILTCAEKLGLDLTKSFAYGDDISDFPMLRTVGNACVVGSDRQLQDIARKEGWHSIDTATPVS